MFMRRSNWKIRSCRSDTCDNISLSTSIAAMICNAAAKHARSSPGRHWFSKKGKPFIINVNATEKILQCLTRSALDRVIVEANPGPGILTAALLKAGAVDVRVLEYRNKWKEKMEELRSLYPTKLQVFDCNLTYLDGLMTTTTSSDFILKDVPKKEWSNKDVLGSLMCTFSAKEDYKTIFHLLYNCQIQHGLFSWGRFNILMICKDQIAQKLTATTGSKFYGRIAVTTQLTCHVKPLIKLSLLDISYKQQQKKDDCTSSYEVLRLTPKINQPFVGYQTFSIEMLQTIMVAKNKKLYSCLRNYHPNVKELLQKLSISLDRRVKDTSPNEFLKIISQCYNILDVPKEYEM